LRAGPSRHDVTWQDGPVADVVVFHSVLGLRPVERAFADRLREAGHHVGTPDLYDGRTASTLDEGFALKDAIGWETIVGRARDAVRDLPAETVLVGVSMGAGVIRAGLPVQVHVADPDPIAPPAQVAAWREAAARAGAEARVFTYPDIGHFYTDADGPDHDEPAAVLTRRRVLDFLSAQA
jgi:dienelactone hydrolase